MCELTFSWWFDVSSVYEGVWWFQEVKKQKDAELKSRTIMKNAKMKLTSQKTEIEKLKVENRELVKKLSTGWDFELYIGSAALRGVEVEKYEIIRNTYY